MRLNSVLHRGVFAMLCSAALPAAIVAQSTGAVAGRVSDANNSPVSAVVVRLSSTALTSTTNGAGLYRIERVPTGTYMLVVRRPGMPADSSRIEVRAGNTTTHNVVLRVTAQQLAGVTVSASPRLNETIEQALFRKRNADNIADIMSGDVIRSLPNANAAEAIARIPGISTERDEGEGKFIQVRGTEPRLSNVTVNGVHIPGTQTGSRVAKLDDVPTDILAAIEVSKTLTADQDADAIGGSVNLVTKTAEGAPRGYIAAQFGQANLLDRQQGQGSATWGGRFGEDRRLGVLLGGTYDRNNRAINDLELGWDKNDAGTPIPVEWDQRDYVYNRTRWGANSALDYRFGSGATLFLKGMWSRFNNFGTRYRYDVSSGGDVATASSGAAGEATDGALVRETSNRTPVEELVSLIGGGKSLVGNAELSYSVNYGATRSSSSDYRTSAFEYTGLGFKYNGADRNYPSYSFLNPTEASAATTPTNYALKKYAVSEGTTRGDDIGGQLDALFQYSVSDHPAQFKIGAKYRDESRDNINLNRSYSAIGTPTTLGAQLGTFTDPNFYSALASGYPIGPQANHPALTAYENANAAQFKETTKPISDSLSNFSGGERVFAAYAMNTFEQGSVRLNLGLRLETTAVEFSGNAATTPLTGAQTVRRVKGTQTYVDIFPSAQLRIAVTDATNLRFAVTRGIARANYSDLAPHTSGSLCTGCATRFNNLSVGNPDLKPQHAWNFDALGESFIGASGVFTFGAFYKQITDFAFRRQFVYQGPATEFNGYYATRPENGGNAHLVGAEFGFTRRFDFLPGAWRGLGFDVNWTMVDSKADVPADTATLAANLGKPVIRSAPLPRQARQIGNFALTFDSPRLSARAAWQYQGASIYTYGDGTASPSGDNWFFPHSQFDASVSLVLTRDVSLQIQGLNLNNAVFGFYNGNGTAQFSNQREYYGRSVIVGIRYGFGAAPGTR